jgi:glutathione peroxidase
MKKLVTVVLLAISLIACKQKTNKEMASDTTSTSNEQQTENIFQFKVKTLTDEEFDFSSLEGKKIMVVNTASECGLTPQYKDLQAIYDTYKDDNFVIVGFPANNFGSQEPGTNKEIAEFCQLNYGVSFPMMAKISVKGDDMHPIYQFLTQRSKNGLEDSEVAWNFQKYLLNESGELVKVISPQTLPTDEDIVSWIKE